jgi:hypothetical protein
MLLIPPEYGPYLEIFAQEWIHHPISCFWQPLKRPLNPRYKLVRGEVSGPAVADQRHDPNTITASPLTAPSSIKQHRQSHPGGSGSARPVEGAYVAGTGGASTAVAAAGVAAGKEGPFPFTRFSALPVQYWHSCLYLNDSLHYIPYPTLPYPAATTATTHASTAVAAAGVAAAAGKEGPFPFMRICREQGSISLPYSSYLQ